MEGGPGSRAQQIAQVLQQRSVAGRTGKLPFGLNPIRLVLAVTFAILGVFSMVQLWEFPSFFSAATSTKRTVSVAHVGPLHSPVPPAPDPPPPSLDEISDSIDYDISNVSGNTSQSSEPLEIPKPKIRFFGNPETSHNNHYYHGYGGLTVEPWLCPGLQKESPFVVPAWKKFVSRQMSVCDSGFREIPRMKIVTHSHLKLVSQTKFLFVDNHCERMGLFATLLMAHNMQGRTLVFSGEWKQFESAHSHCFDKHPPWHCHFLPFHSCDSANEAFNYATKGRLLNKVTFDELRLWYYLSDGNKEAFSSTEHPMMHRYQKDLNLCGLRWGRLNHTKNAALKGMCRKFRFPDIMHDFKHRIIADRRELVNLTWGQFGLEKEVFVTTLDDYAYKIGREELTEQVKDFDIVWVRKQPRSKLSFDWRNWHSDMDPWVSQEFGVKGADKGMSNLVDSVLRSVMNQTNSRLSPLEGEYWSDLSWGQYSALLFSFFLRPQRWLRKQVESNLDYLDVKYDLSSLKPNETMALPIRWGDKCANNPRAWAVGKPEMWCFTVEHFIDLLLFVQESGVIPQLRNVIVTSDTSSIVKMVKKYVRTTDELKHLNLIFNDLDVSQENGIMAAGKTSEKNPLLVMESMLSTVRLQLMAQYIPFYWRSSWARSLWYLSQALDCTGGMGRATAFQLAPPREVPAKLTPEQQKKIEYQVVFERREKEIIEKWRHRRGLKKQPVFKYRGLTINLRSVVPRYGI